MTDELSATEKAALATGKVWRAFGDQFGWRLYAWDGDYTASFELKQDGRLSGATVEILGRQREDIQRVIDRYRLAIDMQPHFADGTPALPDDEGWYPGEEEPGEISSDGKVMQWRGWSAETSECYRTQAEAQAAFKKLGKPL